MRQLNEDNLKILRDRGLINNSEIAYRNVDVLIAENLVTGERRVIDSTAMMLINEDKQLLKG
tara:strand:+ start:335 stop:520 length:186 start_codon:yes stop_codon:yes gene_type:complete